MALTAELVERILYEVWDPLNVRGRAPTDEYRSYVGRILAALEAGADAPAIQDELTQLARSAMGVVGSPARTRRAAEALIVSRDR